MDKLVPELIAFSQYKLGGVQNFYFNILSNAPIGHYEIVWIFEDIDDSDSKLPGLFGVGTEKVFRVMEFEGETVYEMAKRFQNLISDKEGLILCNFPYELQTLDLYRRKKKTIFFICHDEGYLPFAFQFEFLIDVYIAHNPIFYGELVKAMPGRKDDIFYIPYGVKVPDYQKEVNTSAPLRIVIAARMQISKGVYDLPLIDDLLRDRQIKVEWCIIGRGPELTNLIDLVKEKDNFKFYSPSKNKDVLELMKQQDIFILPSRWDGLPVAMLEAMSVGCVPLIGEFNMGISKIITPDTGFVVPENEIKLFADAIESLHNERDFLKALSLNARSKIETSYNITEQAKLYYSLFAKFKELKKKGRSVKIHYRTGILDYPFIPKWFRLTMRNYKKHFIKSVIKNS